MQGFGEKNKWGAAFRIRKAISCTKALSRPSEKRLRLNCRCGYAGIAEVQLVRVNRIFRPNCKLLASRRA